MLLISFFLLKLPLLARELLAIYIELALKTGLVWSSVLNNRATYDNLGYVVRI